MALNLDQAFSICRQESERRQVTLEGWRSSFAHTCKHKGRPAGKFGRAGVGYAWPAWLGKFSKEQDSALRDAVSSIEFDYNLARSLYPEFRGFWPHWAAADLLSTKVSEQVQADEFMMLFAQPKTVEAAIEGLLQAPDFMNPVRKKLEQKAKNEEQSWLESEQLPKQISTSDQLFEHFHERDTRRYTAQHIFQVFLEGVGDCLHFERRPCATCGVRFQPEESEAAVSMMPPILCEPCANVIRLGVRPEDGFLEEQRLDVLSVAATEVHSALGFFPDTLTQIGAILRSRYSEGGAETELSNLWKGLAIWWGGPTLDGLFESQAHFRNHLGLFVEERSGHGGYRSFAECGHLCLSKGERSICDVLHRMGIIHEKEVHYPKDAVLNPNGKFRCDYVFNGRWVEFAGRMVEKSYAERIEDKRTILGLRGIQLEVVIPRTLVAFLEGLRK